ncbi:head GIN domain-containing protein [Tenacibaculum sp. UWU-22]|uniref:head GIN domain-containing protein n=1 Tax=Tenacibaculum sp. UWU-22 TaxID=3234187 RepID=UPI0034DB63CA
MKKTTLTIFVLFCGIMVNAQGWWNTKTIKGNGEITTQSRSTTGYNKIDIGGSFDVMLIDGKEGEITIKGEENIIPYIITEVNHETLTVKSKENTNIKPTKKIVVTIPFKEIKALSLGGSSNVEVKKLIKGKVMSFAIGGSGSITAVVETTMVRTAIGGSGNINLSGKTDELKSSVAGSGNIKAYNLEADAVKASVAGSGDIKISVKNKIKASLVGSGNIYYKGNPTNIAVNSVGSGDIIDKN